MKINIRSIVTKIIVAVGLVGLALKVYDPYIEKNSNNSQTAQKQKELPLSNRNFNAIIIDATNIDGSETADEREKLFKKFPLLVSMLERLDVDKNKPYKSEAFNEASHPGNVGDKREIVERKDTFKVNCNRLSAEWGKNIVTQFLGYKDEYTHLSSNWRPLHDAEDKDATYHVLWNANSFFLNRSNKNRASPSYGLTLACI